MKRTLPFQLLPCYWIVCLFTTFSLNSSSAQCNLGSITLNVVGAPEVELLDVICAPSQNGYYVVFSITGGDPSSYLVSSSISGDLNGPPYTFTSDLIPSGVPYLFVVTDNNNCGEAILEGVWACVCTTEAGNMDLTPLTLCEGETAVAEHVGNEMLDAEDVLVFVLHNGSGSNLGTIYDTNNSPSFEFGPPLVLGETYYISAVAGDDNGSGSFDPNDLCLSVSSGTPVTWTAPPGGNLSNDVDICLGDSAMLVFDLSGTAPFQVSYFADTVQFDLEDLDGTDTIFVSPSITTIYTLVSVEDGSAAGCLAMLADTAIVTVNEPVTQNMATEICEGESIMLGGAMQDQPGLYVDTLNTVAGCDSIIITTLAVNMLDTTALSGTSCDPAQVGIFEEIFTNQFGCDSVVISTISFSETDSVFLSDSTCDPAQAGVFEEVFTNQNGCDSVVTTTTSLLPADTTELSGTSCNPAQVGIFTDIFSNQSGCDSVVISTITFSETDSVFLTSETCEPAQAGVFSDMFINQFGCDSVVTTTVSLLPNDMIELSDTTCDPTQAGVFTEIFSNQYGCDSTVITTVDYVEADSVFLMDSTCDPTQAGVFEEILANQIGCDSVVTTTVSLLPNDLTELFITSCDPSQVGTFTEILTNQNGCDSTIITTVEFSEVDSIFFTNTTCDPAQVGVFSENYTNQFGCDSVATTTVILLPSDETELTETTCDPSQAGTFTEILTNQNGCDSIVVLTVSLLPTDATFLTDTTCDPTQVGTFTEFLANQFGCDSVVTMTVSLLPSDETSLTDTSCDPAQVGVFTETFSNQFGCDSVVITNVSLLSPAECNVEFSLTSAPIPCNSSEGGFTIEILLGQFPMDYSFNSPAGVSGNGVIQASPFSLGQLPAGQYTVTLTMSNGIASTQEIEIIQAIPPSVTIDLVNDLDCNGDQDGAATAVVAGDFPPYTFLWSNGIDSPGIDNLGAGIYEVTVSDNYNCETTAEVAISEAADVEMMFTVSSQDCFDENSGYVEVGATGGNPPYLFAINGGGFQDSDLFPGLSSGAYQVTVQDANGCEASESFAINAPISADVELGNDMTIALGDGATINAIVNLPDSLLENIVWTGLGAELECPTCLAQTTVPLLTTTYTISIESTDGCLDSDDMTVFVDRQRQVYVPNVFSPNGDGVNDLFYPFAKTNAVVKINSFLIFSRWGESVFEAYNFQPNDPNHGWNGMHKGEQMRPAVFVWFAEIEFIDGQVKLFEGEVVLVR